MNNHSPLDNFSFQGLENYWKNYFLLEGGEKRENGKNI